MNENIVSFELKKQGKTRIFAVLIIFLGSLVVGTSAAAISSSVPTGISVTAADSRVTVNFTEPDLTPSSTSPTQSDTRLGYIINVYQGATKLGSTDTCLNGVSATESCVVANYVRVAGGNATLENGVTYFFKIIARWSDGNTEVQSSESIASSQAIPFTSPSKPAAPTGIINSTTSTSVDVSWVAPSDNGESIDLYTITVWNKSGMTQITSNTGCTSSTLTCTVSGLILGSAYTFKVKANNSAGDSVDSDVSNAVTIVPGLATSIASVTTTATDGTTSIKITWAAPVVNDEAITEYTVTATAGTTTVDKTTTGAREATFTADLSGADLVLGTEYRVKVKAKNTGGYGAYTSDSDTTVTPSRIPGTPTSIAATFNGRTAVITWAAPSSNGGDAITEYTASAFASSATDSTGTSLGTCTWTGALTCSIPNLVAGTGYKFAVKAKNNANGYGAYSSLSSIATAQAITAPGAPTAVTATFNGRTAAITWAAPSSNGGDAITEYTASAFASSATDSTGTSLGTCTSTGALTCSIQNLVAGTGYKFAVKAKNNASGYGAYSSLSSIATAPAIQVVTTTVPVVTTTIETTAPVTTTTVSAVNTTAPAVTTTVVSTTTIAYVNYAAAAKVPSTKLSAASGIQVSISRAPATSMIKEIEVAVSSKKVSMYISTPASKNTKTAIVKYVIELRPVSGTSIKKTVVVKSAQVIKPNLTGKPKTTYTVVIVAYQKSGRSVTWKGPKVVTK